MDEYSIIIHFLFTLYRQGDKLLERTRRLGQKKGCINTAFYLR